MSEETFICDICGEEHAEAACTYWDDQQFDAIQVNPITFRKDSKIKKVESFRKMLL